VHGSYRYLAYTDNALPTAGVFTTSAPSVIATMIYHVGIQRGEKLLEIGTGTGYEAAILAEMGVHVFTVEFDRHLALQANGILTLLGYKFDKTLGHQGGGENSSAWYREMSALYPLPGDHTALSRERAIRSCEILSLQRGHRGCFGTAPPKYRYVGISIERSQRKDGGTGRREERTIPGHS
jgi:hypothetical protein